MPDNWVVPLLPTAYCWLSVASCQLLADFQAGSARLGLRGNLWKILIISIVVQEHSRGMGSGRGRVSEMEYKRYKVQEIWLLAPAQALIRVRPEQTRQFNDVSPPKHWWSTLPPITPRLTCCSLSPYLPTNNLILVGFYVNKEMEQRPLIADERSHCFPRNTDDRRSFFYPVFGFLPDLLRNHFSCQKQ